MKGLFGCLLNGTLFSCPCSVVNMLQYPIHINHHYGKYRLFQLTAYHESGHAIVALNTEGAHPIHKATIMPRGSALGMVTQLPSNDETSISKKQLLARLDVCMGGRVAEELVFGPDNVTTGASSDLHTATELAQYMVQFRYIMSITLSKIVNLCSKNTSFLFPFCFSSSLNKYFFKTP